MAAFEDVVCVCMFAAMTRCQPLAVILHLSVLFLCFGWGGGVAAGLALTQGDSRARAKRRARARARGQVAGRDGATLAARREERAACECEWSTPLLLLAASQPAPSAAADAGTNCRHYTCTQSYKCVQE